MNLPCRFMSGRRPILIAAVIALLSFAGRVGGAGPDPSGKGSLYGKPAPDFKIKGIYGETYSMDLLRGRLALIQFGTSW